VDSVWEQEEFEAGKMLENGAQSHTSGARFVGRRRLEIDPANIKHKIKVCLSKIYPWVVLHQSAVAQRYIERSDSLISPN
jgi:hypothetical protein